MAAVKDTSIRRTLMGMMFATGATVLLLTCTAFLAYEFVTFRQSATRQLATLGQIIAANSTAALAFDNPEDAQEVLGALLAEPDIVAAVLYDGNGRRFASYPGDLAAGAAPASPGADGFRFESGRLVGFQRVAQGGQQLGTLYLAADQGALYARLRLYGLIAVLVIASAMGLAYPLSRRLQQQISTPILGLAKVAEAVSTRHDYSVRAPEIAGGELGLLTRAFNHMLSETGQAEGRLRGQLARLGLLSRLTRAIGERQDLPSVFRVVAGTLESDMPLDFACLCLYDTAQDVLSVEGVGAKSFLIAAELGLSEGSRITGASSGLERCLAGEVVHEADTLDARHPFTQRLAQAGLRSLIAAPLRLESRVLGVLVAASRAPGSFGSTDAEFLAQLSEHVALAAHQSRIHEALQEAYDDLRHSQNTVLQQERLRALGQMASGIAHDINNAISPVALYVENLLEKEQNLSPRARDYLKTIERAIDDVAATVARMREFYRQREPQLSLAPADLNALVHQVIDLTRARWLDIPQQRGAVMDMRTELAPSLPRVMVAETEVRDALTNLIFNAVDAMPDGGTLTLSTAVVSIEQDTGPVTYVQVSVGDTGIGMDEDTRRRCLEPFFTTKGERGTGLGLAMVYGMIQRHSADIDIASEPGKGTTFQVRFPVPVDVAAAAAGPVTASPLPSRQRILVVDDDPLLIKSLSQTLTDDGHDVVTAPGGREGVEAFRAAVERNQVFDVVITDLGMPHMDGRQVAAEIKRMSRTTPVIMLTGWGQRMAAEGDVPPHVDRLLAKPPKLAILRTAFLDLCRQEPK